jgi:hypothetical protein
MINFESSKIQGNPPAHFDENRGLEDLVGIAPVKNGLLAPSGGVLAKLWEGFPLFLHPGVSHSI